MNHATRRLSIAAGAVVIASTIGCASSLDLHTSLAQTALTSKYGTFFVLPAGANAAAKEQQLDAEIVKMLADKGMVEMPPAEAEAVVVVHTATAAEHSRDAFYHGWGGWDWKTTDARSLGGVETYKPGTLVVDFFDAWTKQLVWHGAATPSGSMEKTVDDLFRDFPLARKNARADFGSTPAAPHAAAQPVRIVFSPTPAVLIRIHGEPRYEGVTGTGLQRVANTNALILRDEIGQHYTRVAGRWLEADDVLGPWTPAGTVPPGAHAVLREDTNLRRSDLFGSAESFDRAPVVYVSTAPMSLVVTDGDPHYGALEGTGLLRLSNSSAAVFKEPTDRELYVHLTDGWFRAWTTDGPWQAVEEADLPADLSVRVQSGLI